MPSTVCRLASRSTPAIVPAGLADRSLGGPGPTRRAQAAPQIMRAISPRVRVTPASLIAGSAQRVALSDRGLVGCTSSPGYLLGLITTASSRIGSVSNRARSALVLSLHVRPRERGVGTAARRA